ncbi:MAG: hypothetical protein QUU85_03905 [Candidatus Eisenbacteria bacterium]|nr:hypothetical protein [Candidatus Eisenbacteria bacterium]
MKTRILQAVLLAAALVSFSGVASATPDVNSAVIQLRIFNDCPTSVVTTDNSYPTTITIRDSQVNCQSGFANLHNWRFSEDGATPAVFNNADAFRFGAWLVLDGTLNGESGLQVSPWWSQDVDGRLNVKAGDGEIAAFGGRLPFYSFTASQGLTYQRGTPIYLEIVYYPHDLTQQNPGTIEYKLNYNGTDYTSGVLAFDEGNPNEPYGTWGILDNARVGAHLQVLVDPNNPEGYLDATWRDIMFEKLDGACCLNEVCQILPEEQCLNAGGIYQGNATGCDPNPCGTAVETSTWGRVKSSYR